MKPRILRALIPWLLLGLTAPLPAVAAAGDVRIIVDVSAAMGRADPDNRRGEALGLLLRLLPEGSDAGVWTYGQYVNMLVKYDQVGGLWKENAAILTADLESVGQRSNLLEAVERATWDRAAADGPADVVLLTDGRLDVSDDPGIDEAQRRRLLADLAPELAAAGYRVHALTLSDRADNALLGQLAALTGGHHGRLEGAAELPEGLLAVLGWVAGPATLTLSEQGSFEVAPGTGALTALRPGGGLDTPAALVTPGGERLTRTTSRQRLRWHVGREYELITVDDPAPGRWRFEGVGAGGRVYAYTDLTLDYPDLPGTLFPDRLRTFDLVLSSGGQIIDDADFLSLIDVSARLHGAGGDRPLVVEPGDDGRFAVNMMGPEQAGEYLLETRVWGPTFEQTLSLPLVLKHPLSVEIHPAEDGFVLWVQVSAAELDHDALRLAALVKRPPGAARMFPLERMPAGLWKLVVPGARGLAEVTLDLKGSYLNDRPFDLRTQPIRIVLPVPGVRHVDLGMDGRPALVTPAPVAEAEPRSAANRPGPATPPPAAPPALPATAEPAAPEAPDAVLPVWLAVMVAVVNLAIGLSVWWLIGAPRRDPEQDEMLNALRRAAGLPEEELPGDTAAEEAGEAEAPAEKAAA